MNKSAVRRALTTLKKNGVITSTFLKGKGNESACIKVIVPSDLIQPKKRVYIRKTKSKKDYTTYGGVSN